MSNFVLPKEVVMKKIIWEAWQDPLNSNADEFNKDKNVIFNQSPNALQDYDEETEPIFGISPQKIIGTPHGLLSLTENTLASKRFEFWLVHTNFDITKDFVQKLEQIPGIESIEVFTRYRLRVGLPISGLFNLSKTKYKVEQLVRELNTSEMQYYISHIKNAFGDKKAQDLQEVYDKVLTRENWAIYITPNGNFDIITSEKYDQFYQSLTILQNVKSLVGGFLISSE